MFLKNCLIQFSLPICIIGIPVIARMISLYFADSIMINEFGNFFQTFYGLVFTITTMSVYKPYRCYFTNLISCRKEPKILVHVKTSKMERSTN
ncbi:unnamed protein product, partial [Mesorhabditis belari]|uniref:Uncharacterized protein n=1 Tax=Mesorhabditis belari TaxID=2138241 RepID=A0AAF3ED30_9BILA